MKQLRWLSTVCATTGLLWCVVVGGAGVVPLVVPVLVGAWAAWAAWRQSIAVLAVATAIFLGFCFIAGFSIGGAYVPTGIGLVAATLLGIVAK